MFAAQKAQAREVMQWKVGEASLQAEEGVLHQAITRLRCWPPKVRLGAPLPLNCWSLTGCCKKVFDHITSLVNVSFHIYSKIKAVNQKTRY